MSDSRDEFVQRYKFNLQPATDNKPFFQHFMRWSSLPEMIGLINKGGASLIESGYFILLAGLLIAVCSSFVLIILPVFLGKKAVPGQSKIDKTAVLLYFSAIGLAFLFLEIALLQKCILFLHHPVFASSAVITSFLVFAGLGSAATGVFTQRMTRKQLMNRAIGALSLLAMLYIVLLPWIYTAASDLAMPLRFVVVVLLIAPLAFVMGMPMPLGLRQLEGEVDKVLPWAWAINGCASVISVALASLLAIQFGFNAVMMLAILLYGIAWFMFPEIKYDKQSGP